MTSISSLVRYISFAFIVLACCPAFAQPNAGVDVQIESVSVGLGGVARVGTWTPVRVVVKSAAQGAWFVECETPDPGGSPFFVRQEVSLDAGKVTSVELISIPGRLETDFVVRVRASDQTVRATRRITSERSATRAPDFSVEPHDVPMWLVVGDVPGVRTRPRVGNRKPNTAAPGFRVIESDGFTSVVESRATDSFDVVLTEQPGSDVVIQVAVNDATVASVDRTQLRFNSSDWDKPQTVVVTATNDVEVDGTQQATISLTRAGSDATASGQAVTIDIVARDDEFGMLDQCLTAADFPHSWKSLAAYDTIILSGEFAFGEQQADALKTWTLRGGNLVCAIGSRVDEFRASSLSSWLSKFEVTKSDRVSDVGGFESFVGSTSRIPPSRSAGCTIASLDAVSLVQNIDGDLVLLSAMGVGRVTLCGVDLDKSPFSNWRANSQLLLKLSDFESSSDGDQSQNRRFSRTGITELQSQLQIALESGDSRSHRSTLAILALILVYLVIIGPGDFALVHRVFKAPGKTWITFPGLVILIAFGANMIAGARNGSELSTKQIELIDIDAQTGFVREKTWFTVYSPENRRYRVATEHSPRLFAAQNSAEIRSAGVRWVGMPEASYGGLYRQRGVELGKAVYSFASDYSSATDLPIPVWSNRVMESEAFGQANVELIENQIKRAGNGQFANSSSITHHLSAPIDNWLILYGSRLYSYNYNLAATKNLPPEDATIRPGVPWNVDADTVSSQQLSNYMTGTIAYKVKSKRISDEQVEHAQTKYNPRATDVLPIIQMLTIHDEVGGKEYTALFNHSLKEFEFSKLLWLDRAIIIGTVNVPSTEVKINGKTIEPVSRQSIVRIVIPVLEKEAIRRTLPKIE